MVRRENLLIIEAASREVRFLSWQRRFGRKVPEVSFRSIPYEADSLEEDCLRARKSLVEILLEYRQKKFKTRSKVPAYLLIPFQNGLIREFRLPWISKRERNSALHYYLQHEVPLLADDLLYTSEVLEEKEKEYLRLRVTAVRKDIIKAYAESLNQAGYALKGIEYSVSALGEIIGLYSANRVLFLQGLNADRIQLVMFKDGYPEVIREFSANQYEITKYHLYLELNEQEFPIGLLLTDGGTAAERAAGLLLEAGLVKEQLKTGSLLSALADLPKEITEQGFGTYALLGEKLRAQNRKNMDFTRTMLRPLKVKTLAVLCGIFLAACILLGGVNWYPRIIDYVHLQKEISLLEDRQARLEGEEEQNTWVEWQRARKIAGTDLSLMQKALRQAGPDLTFTRLNYKQNTLFLWAECKENTAIAKLIGILTAQGWREPVLTDYKYQPEKIAFAVSVKR